MDNKWKELYNKEAREVCSRCGHHEATSRIVKDNYYDPAEYEYFCDMCEERWRPELESIEVWAKRNGYNLDEKFD